MGTVQLSPILIKNQLLRFPIPICSLEEQNQIVRKLNIDLL
jgi:restriction endonuclease S subunit